jgi:hypothetical protein
MVRAPLDDRHLVNHQLPGRLEADTEAELELLQEDEDAGRLELGSDFLETWGWGAGERSDLLDDDLRGPFRPRR